ncbi:hypothetical protein Tco_0837162 [Tanacetum coccineum]
MNYVPVVARKSSNDFAGIQGVSESSTSSQQDQDWIVMPIWKDASYFGDASPKTVDVNTVRPDINTGSREVSTALPEVITTTPEDLFNYSDVKSASTPTDLEKPLVQDGDVDDVDEHLYRSMIGTFGCTLTASHGKISCLLSCECSLDPKPTTGLRVQLYAKKLIQMVKIDTEHNVADLLTKGFDAGRFQYLVSKKSTGSAGFHQVIDFLNRSHICYALIKKPAVSVSFIKQFWRSAKASTDDNREVKIIATIDEDDLRNTKNTYSSAFTKLILSVKKLESQIKTTKTRRKARIVHSDDEDIEDDSSKQGRKLSDAEVQEAEVQEKASTETEPFIQEVTPTEVIQDQGSSEKGSAEVSATGATKGTASEVPVVSTAEEDISTAGRTVTYTRGSAEKRSRQDKGKAIMIESEPKKKSKKEFEQERISFAEAIRLEEQMNKEQRA